MKCRGNVLHPTDSRGASLSFRVPGPQFGAFLGAFSGETRLSSTGGLPKDCNLENERLQTMTARRELLRNASCWAVALSLGMVLLTTESEAQPVRRGPHWRGGRRRIDLGSRQGRSVPGSDLSMRSKVCIQSSHLIGTRALIA